MQAFIIVGGRDIPDYFLSVLTLLPGATNWTQLASFPRSSIWAGASIVGGRLRVNGGFLPDDGSYRSEVMIEK